MKVDDDDDDGEGPVICVWVCQCVTRATRDSVLPVRLVIPCSPCDRDSGCSPVRLVIPCSPCDS